MIGHGLSPLSVSPVPGNGNGGDGWRSIGTFVVMAFLAACSSSWEPAFDQVAASALFDTVAIADPDEALTFARFDDNGTRRVIAVREYRNGVVRGVDIARITRQDAKDPIAVFNQLGYDTLRNYIRAARPEDLITFRADQLVIPVDLHDRHIAVGTNFPEHAGDAGVEDGPFLFPKLVQPTGPRDAVPAGTGLLDYEVEVAWVTLGPLPRGDKAEWMGLLLANDFTDRETLLHGVDPWNPASGDGFATGKSFPGFLPIGNLFVVPKDHRRFAAALNLHLYLDRILRQRSTADAMVWDFDAIIAHTWEWQDRRWDHRGQQVSLFGNAQAIPARTLILSGTPHGTVFAGIGLRHKVYGLGRWLLGGWSEPIPKHVIDVYIEDAHRAGAYLRPGQTVEIHVDRMGVLSSPIVPELPI